MKKSNNFIWKFDFKNIASFMEIWRVYPSGSEALAKSTHLSGTKTIELAVLG